MVEFLYVYVHLPLLYRLFGAGNACGGFGEVGEVKPSVENGGDVLSVKFAV